MRGGKARLLRCRKGTQQVEIINTGHSYIEGKMGGGQGLASWVLHAQRGLPVPGKQEKGEPLTEKLFEEGARPWGRTGFYIFSSEEEMAATCHPCANHLARGTCLDSRSYI